MIAQNIKFEESVNYAQFFHEAAAEASVQTQDETCGFATAFATQ